MTIFSFNYIIYHIILYYTIGWSLYEQVYIAALEYGDIELVDICSEALNKNFPDSIRVKRLLGMQYEFNKEFDKALELYNNLLMINPSNLLLLKRKVFRNKYNLFCYFFSYDFILLFIRLLLFYFIQLYFVFYNFFPSHSLHLYLYEFSLVLYSSWSVFPILIFGIILMLFMHIFKSIQICDFCFIFLFILSQQFYFYFYFYFSYHLRLFLFQSLLLFFSSFPYFFCLYVRCILFMF